MGCPRSGTTILADSLGVLPNAFLKIGVFMPDRTMHLIGSGTLSPAAREHLLWAHRYSFWRGLIEMHGSWQTTLRHSVRTASFQPFLRRKRPISQLLLVYKEPFLNFACEEMARHFSKAKFIHIVRDGRDCADSMERCYPHALTDDILRSPLLWRLKGSEIGVAREWRGWFLPWWLESGAEQDFLALPPYGRYVWMWKVMVRRGQALAAQIKPERFLEIRYEAFCKQPVEVGERILDFLKTPMGGAYRRFLRSVTANSVGCHRRQPKEVLVQSERIGSPLLGELQYV
jgi:Sulfotransferase family